LKLLPVEIQFVSAEKIFSAFEPASRLVGPGFGGVDAGLLSAVACVARK
jgi:hypothetical protein